MKTRKVPYKCPVCNGSGEGPYISTGLSNTLPPKCKACKGEGLVWGEEVDDSIDFSKITINPTPAVPSDNIPWYDPYAPYKIVPYDPPYPLWPTITWSYNNNTDCPNFGF